MFLIPPSVFSPPPPSALGGGRGSGAPGNSWHPPTPAASFLVCLLSSPSVPLLLHSSLGGRVSSFLFFLNSFVSMILFPQKSLLCVCLFGFCGFDLVTYHSTGGGMINHPPPRLLCYRKECPPSDAGIQAHNPQDHQIPQARLCFVSLCVISLCFSFQLFFSYFHEIASVMLVSKTSQLFPNNCVTQGQRITLALAGVLSLFQGLSMVGWGFPFMLFFTW